MIFLRYKFLLAATLFLNLSFAAAPTPRRVIFLHTNDQHGHFYGKLENGQRAKNGYALENLVAHAEAIRSEAGKDAEVILTFGGDLNTGTPESALFRAQPDMELLRLAGLKVAVVGNHEFDNAPEVFEKQIARSGFSWISANVERQNGGQVTRPHLVIPAGKLRIGFLGLTTEQTAKVGNPQNIKPYRFTDAIAAARRSVDKLRGETDFIVALTHLGLYPQNQAPFGYADDRAVAEKVADVDLILGGHSHNLIDAQVINGVRVFQAKCFSAYLVRVDYEIAPRATDGKAQARFISSQVIDLRTAPRDLKAHEQKKRAEARLVIDAYLAKSAEKFGEVIAESEDDFHYEREHVLKSPITALVAQSQLAESRADIAVLIAGGIRGGFKKGKITLRDVLTVFPFDNTVGIVEMSGRELTELLEGRILRSSDRGGYPVVAGLDVEILPETKSLRLIFQGKPLEAKRVYRIAINSYMASGGSGYPDYISRGRFTDLGETDAMLLARYLRQKGRINREMMRSKRP